MTKELILSFPLRIKHGSDRENLFTDKYKHDGTLNYILSGGQKGRERKDND